MPAPRGFSALGGQEARVRLTVTPGGERLIRGRSILQNLLVRMNVEAQVQVAEQDGGMRLDLTGGTPAGSLAGTATLEAVQLLVGRILNRQIGERTRVPPAAATAARRDGPPPGTSRSPAKP